MKNVLTIADDFSLNQRFCFSFLGNRRQIWSQRATWPNGRQFSCLPTLPQALYINDLLCSNEIPLLCVFVYGLIFLSFDGDMHCMGNHRDGQARHQTLITCPLYFYLVLFTFLLHLIQSKKVKIALIFLTITLLLYISCIQGPRGGRGARGPTGKPGAKVRDRSIFDFSNF